MKNKLYKEIFEKKVNLMIERIPPILVTKHWGTDVYTRIPLA